jgi:ABC-2 type transport system ATP-binding protein
LRQRVGIADALVSEPPLLILDEPTAGLDPNQIREVRELIGTLRGKHTVLLSTHILAEAEVTCDRAIVLSHGRVVASGTLGELGEQQRRATISLLHTEIEEPALAELLGPVCRLEQCERVGAELRCTVSLTDTDGLAPVLQRLVQAGLQVAEATLAHTNLEDVFARLTREDEDG